jgi:hypothetical protein
MKQSALRKQISVVVQEFQLRLALWSNLCRSTIYRLIAQV